MPEKKRALLVIDIQNDFCPGGVLAVPGGDEIIPLVNSLLPKFELVIATQDWHPPHHISFASHWGKQPGTVINIKNSEQVLWPNHCVQGTRGADFHPQLTTQEFNWILRKGTNPELDSYSGFFENDRMTATGLEFLLKGLGVNSVYICGLATDYCVFFTAMDAVHLGFNTFVVPDACRGINYPVWNLERALETMKNNRIHLTKTCELDF
jgi:nicotinamidase/pyrazinamidase